MGTFRYARLRRSAALSPILFLTLFAAGAFLAACTASRLPERDGAGVFTIWAFSDIQPRTEGEKKFFQWAVDDVRDNALRYDLAVVGGDIAQYPTDEPGPETWGWYRDLLATLPGKPVFEIAGNHDARRIDDYLEKTGRPLHYAVLEGNLLIIMLSDEDPSSGSDIPDPVFRWWERLVAENQDKIIVTVTHSPLKGSGFAWNYPSRRTIVGSERFTEVLRRHRVDLWLFGHTHVASPLGSKTRTVAGLGGTTFVNISAIREDYLLCDAESRFISFAPGSDIAIVRTRNHVDRAFDESMDRVVRVGVPFIPGRGAATLLPDAPSAGVSAQP